MSAILKIGNLKNYHKIVRLLLVTKNTKLFARTEGIKNSNLKGARIGYNLHEID